MVGHRPVREMAVGVGAERDRKRSVCPHISAYFHHQSVILSGGSRFCEPQPKDLPNCQNPRSRANRSATTLWESFQGKS